MEATEKLRQEYNALISNDEPGATDEITLDAIGHLFDLSLDLRESHGLEVGRERLKDLHASGLSHELACLGLYFEANSWTYGAIIARDETEEAPWKSSSRMKSIACLRKSIRHQGFEKIAKPRRCQILVNLGLDMYRCGRLTESIELSGAALALDPSFDKARACRGRSLAWYGLSLWSTYEQQILLAQGYQDLKRAMVKGKYIEDPLPFVNFIEALESRVSVEVLERPIVLHDHRQSGDKPPQEFKEWALCKRLYLNPLNDAFTDEAVAEDPQHLPSLVSPLDEGPYLIGFFNQLKQEYVTARALLYDSQARRPNTTHFSDYDVRLIDTLDYPAYGYRVELAKISSRLGHSILDKCAYFIARFNHVEQSEVVVDFRKLWELPAIRCLDSWPLRGLYWISRDINETDGQYRESMEPDASELRLMRNCMEHRFLKVHHEHVAPDLGGRGERGKREPDYSINLPLLMDRSHRILKLTRHALILLALHVKDTEDKRRKADSSVGLAVPIHLLSVPDELKT